MYILLKYIFSEAARKETLCPIISPFQGVTVTVHYTTLFSDRVKTQVQPSYRKLNGLRTPWSDGTGDC